VRAAQLPRVERVLDFVGGEIFEPHGRRHVDVAGQREACPLLWRLNQAGVPGVAQTSWARLASALRRRFVPCPLQALKVRILQK
jgi:hypothetical protein